MTTAFTIPPRGCASDIDFINIFNKYGVKATFNIVGAYADNAKNAGKLDIYASAFDGHEIASHSKTHPEMNKSTFEAARAVTVSEDRLTVSNPSDTDVYGLINGAQKIIPAHGIIGL